MNKKPVKSIILGEPTIGILFLMAQGLMDTFDLLLREYDRFPKRSGYHKIDDTSIKEMGIIMNKNMLLPFVCELSLTALYLLDHPRSINIPKKETHDKSGYTTERNHISN